MGRFGFDCFTSTSPEGRAAKNRGSKCKLASLSHDGVFGFDCLASTSPEGRAAKNRGSKCKLASLSHDGVFGFDCLASIQTTDKGFVFGEPFCWSF